jgi:ketosteroid isomerase-like protein
MSAIPMNASQKSAVLGWLRTIVPIAVAMTVTSCSPYASAARAENVSAASQPSEEAAVLDRVRDVLKMYQSMPDKVSLEMAERIYVPDAVKPPIVMDMSATDGEPWSNKGKNGWIEVMRRYNALPADLRPSELQFELKEPQVVIGGNLAAVATRLGASFKSAGGGRVNLETRYTFVFLKVNGTWMLWHEHWSVPVQAAGPAQKAGSDAKDKGVISAL